LARGVEATTLEYRAVKQGQVVVTIWVRFDVLNVRLYIGPNVDLRVLRGVTIAAEN